MRYNGGMKVITYSRVSTSHHDQNPDIQVQELRRFCAARGWTIKTEIVEQLSGGTDRRPGLQKLLEAVRRREVDGIVVTKMDRLFRSLRHLVTALDEFSALGVQFVAVRDNIDYTTPSGRLMVQVLGSLAEFERALLRERTMMGLDYARSKGVRLGRPQHRMKSQIVELARQGKSYREIKKMTGASLGTISTVVRGVQKSGVKDDA